MIKAIVFDCFGVLYLDHRQSLAVQFPWVAQELWEINRQSDAGLLDRDEYLAQASRLVGWTSEQLVQFTHDEHRLNKELVATIRHDLKSHYKIGLLSNIGRNWRDDFFATRDFEGLFDEQVLSGEEGVVKPHPGAFELIADRLGVHTSECIMVDDRRDNCQGAEFAGMSAIHFTSNTDFSNHLATLLDAS